MNLRDHLQAIHDQHGKLTPALVVTEARDPDHPLHHRFEWDDKVAGEKYRRVQAAALIRSVRVTYAQGDDGRPKTVREFVNVARQSPLTDGAAVEDGDDAPENVYMPTAVAMQNEFTRQLILRQCEIELRTIKAKYAHLREFANIVSRVFEEASTAHS